MLCLIFVKVTGVNCSFFILTHFSSRCTPSVCQKIEYKLVGNAFLFPLKTVIYNFIILDIITEIFILQGKALFYFLCYKRYPHKLQKSDSMK